MAAITMGGITMAGIPVGRVAVVRSFEWGREVYLGGRPSLHNVGERVAIEPGVYDKPDVWHEASEVALYP